MSGAVPPSGPWQVPVDRDVVEASGPDAATFLQGQLSQDVAGLAGSARAVPQIMQ